MMEQWNRDQISSTFRHKAREAKKYCEEIKSKSNPSYEFFYDQSIAEHHVYEYLHKRPCLSSREQLLEELHKMLSYEIKPVDCYDLDRFEECRQRFINNEISKFKNT